MPENIDFLAMIAELHQALDRQSDRFERSILHLTNAMVNALDRIDQRFEKMDQRFERMDQRFERMDQRFERIEGELIRLNGRMEKVEDKLTDLNTTAKHLLLENKVIVLKINSIDEAVARIEKFQQSQEDVLRRLGVLEGVVLKPVSVS
jgi:predicted nuclease with TOPRIM domain